MIFLGSSLLAFLIGLEEGARGALITVFILYGGNLLWYIVGMLVVGPYFRSLIYEIDVDEVIVRAGIWTRSVKHVPYRTVTNLTIKKDIVDRFLGIGTLQIQTAGMSGTTGAEENLVGLEDVDKIYDKVVGELRRFRGALPATGGGNGAETGEIEATVLREILAEIQAIREKL
jgi:putative membrane protein